MKLLTINRKLVLRGRKLALATCLSRCCNGGCNSFRPFLPRCQPAGQCGGGLVYLCVTILTDQGRTVEDMLQGVGGSAGGWILLDGECYRVTNPFGSPLTRQQVLDSIAGCPGRIVDTASVVERGASDPGEEVCGGCGCCEIVTFFPDDCAFQSEGECGECSEEYTFEASATASVEQVMTQAGLDYFYPAPTPRPPGGIAYRGDVTWTLSGRKICDDGVPRYECFSLNLRITQRSWDQNFNGGSYRTNEIVSTGCDSPWFGVPQCGADSAGRGRFGGINAYIALMQIEIGSFLRARPFDGTSYGPALLEICTTNGPSVDREFSTQTTPPAGSYSVHRQQWNNVASAMNSSCIGNAQELYFSDDSFGTGNYQHLWTNFVTWASGRSFLETTPCREDGPRCDSPGWRAVSQRKRALSSQSTAAMLAAMGA